MFYIFKKLLLPFNIISEFLLPQALVHGDSMYPTLVEGDVLRASRIPIIFRKFKVGSIYIFKSPKEDKLVIKRLTHIEENKLYFLGDNPCVSYDSRDYGLIEKKDVIAKVLYKCEDRGANNEENKCTKNRR